MLQAGKPICQCCFLRPSCEDQGIWGDNVYECACVCVCVCEKQKERISLCKNN